MDAKTNIEIVHAVAYAFSSDAKTICDIRLSTAQAIALLELLKEAREK